MEWTPAVFEHKFTTLLLFHLQTRTSFLVQVLKSNFPRSCFFKASSEVSGHFSVLFSRIVPAAFTNLFFLA